MCIICAKPSRVQLPDDDIISRMFYRNPDGAGIMYTTNGVVKIVKGLMTLESVFNALDAIKREIDVEEEAMVLHFRIGTAGGNIPANTHPYPITDSLAQLQALSVVTNIGVAHNGIIDITPRQKDINDTMEYIMSQLAPLKRGCPKFYQNKHLMAMIKNAISSKMAFLTADKQIYTVGDFHRDGELLYSNDGYLPYYYRSYRFNHTSWDSANGYWSTGWSDDYDDYGNPYPSANKTAVIPFYGDSSRYKKMMWLDDGEFIVTEEGEYVDSAYNIIMMDEKGEVYVYDAEEDEAIYIGGNAFNEHGKSLAFDPLRAHYEYVNPTRDYYSENPMNAIVKDETEHEPSEADEASENSGKEDAGDQPL